jgi:hypothetical protein
MRGLAIAIVLVVAPGAVLADATSRPEVRRLDIRNMSCHDVQAALGASGTAVLRRPSIRIDGIMLYEKYVAGGRDCRMQDIAARVAVPTSDARSPHACRVIQCKEPGRSEAR